MFISNYFNYIVYSFIIKTDSLTENTSNYQAAMVLFLFTAGWYNYEETIQQLGAGVKQTI